MKQSGAVRFICQLATALVGAVLTYGVAAAQPQPLSTEKLYQYLAPSVWVVRTYDSDGILLSTGSAVVIGPETLLTNCHVIKGARRFVVRNDNIQHDARLQHIDVPRDMCQITARNLRAPSVVMGDSDQLSVGQKVYALGAPRAMELTLSDGLISALRREDDSRALFRIQTSAPISPGSSGGGLFNSAGHLIGITTSTLIDAQNLNFAIPINWHKDLAARSDAVLTASRAAAPVAVAAPPAASAPGVSRIPLDIDAMTVSESCKTEFRKYLTIANPKAFAITTSGRCAWQAGRVPFFPQVTTAADLAVRAMEWCVHVHKTGCSLYAVDAAVVYAR